MTEQKKARAVVLPCGILAGDRKTYCGDCSFWEKNDEKSRDYGRDFGYCCKNGSKFATEFCFEGSDS